MAAGFNLRVDIWRIDWAEHDDRVGGAVVTGTIVYHSIMARMEQEEEDQLFAQQGLETIHIFRMNIIPGTLTIYERDEVEIIQPRDHHYYGQKFRVKNIRYSSHNPRDPRSYIMLNLTRSDRMHRQQ